MNFEDAVHVRGRARLVSEVRSGETSIFNDSSSSQKKKVHLVPCHTHKSLS